MNKKARTLLQQVLLQHLEQDISQVPEEQEIRKQHSFSEEFEENMEKLASEQDRVIKMEKKNKLKTRRGLFLKVAAACLGVAVIFGAVALSSIRMGASKEYAGSYDTAAAADSGAGGLYNGSEYKAEASMEMEAADTPAEEYAVSDEVAPEEGSYSESMDSTTVKNGQKLIYTIRMEMETTAYDTLVSDIRAKVETLGGYIESSETSGNEERHNRSSYLTVRIPAEKRNELTETVKTEANVYYSSERAEDVTLEYVDTQSRIDSLRTEQQTLMELLERAENIDTVLAIQNQLTEVRYQLESYESRLKVLENQVTYSTFYLNIFEVQRVTVPEESSFLTKLQERFISSLQALGEGGENILLFILGDFPILLVTVIVAAAVFLLIRKIIGNMKRKKKMPENEPDKRDNE